MSLLTPVQEIAKRFGEVVPGIKAAAGAVGLEDHRRMLRDHAARVRSDDRAHRELLGWPTDEVNPETDEMGDIIITGDIHVESGDEAANVLKLLKGKAVDQVKAAGSKLGKAAKLAALVAIPALTGFGGAFTALKLFAPVAQQIIHNDAPPAPVVEIDPNQYDIRGEVIPYKP